MAAQKWTMVNDRLVPFIASKYARHPTFPAPGCRHHVRIPPRARGNRAPSSLAPWCGPFSPSRAERRASSAYPPSPHRRTLSQSWEYDAESQRVLHADLALSVQVLRSAHAHPPTSPFDLGVLRPRSAANPRRATAAASPSVNGAVPNSSCFGVGLHNGVCMATTALAGRASGLERQCAWRPFEEVGRLDWIVLWSCFAPFSVSQPRLQPPIPHGSPLSGDEAPSMMQRWRVATAFELFMVPS